MSCDPVDSTWEETVGAVVDVSVDPAGSTIHTVAEDVALGEPVRVTDTVNGGPVTTAGPDGSEGPAEVSHTYYVKDPGDPAADADGWRPLRDDERVPDNLKR